MIRVLVLAMCVACGRIAFDATGDASSAIDDVDAFDDPLAPDLEVVDSPTVVRIKAPGRFLLYFDSLHRWQASEWYDLESDPTSQTNLVRDDGFIGSNVLQAPALYDLGAWVTLESAFATVKGVEQDLDPKQVKLLTEYVWDLGAGRMLHARATHVLTSSGEWHVTLRLEETPVSQEDVTGIEFADSHINWALGGWVDTTEDLQNERYSFVRSTTTPRPRFKTTRSGTLGTLQVDEPGSRYWHAVGVGTGQGLDLSWTNKIWPPER